MENSLTNTNQSSIISIRPRKSIFASQKPKSDDQQPKLMLNGETLTQWPQKIKSSTSPNFFTPSHNDNEGTLMGRLVESKMESGAVQRSVYVSDDSVNRVIFASPNNTPCIRPSSVGKRSVIINSHQIVQKPVPVMNQFIVSPAQPQFQPQPQVLKNSFFIPSQSSNIMTTQVPNLTKTSSLKRKCILVEGKPRQNVIFRHSSIETQPVQIVTGIRPQMNRIVIQQNRPQVNRILIQDDPKTISQLNKLSSLNQFLTQQYNLINNELSLIKSKTCQKEFVVEKSFLEKSMNKIDDIFARQTSHALYKLEEISRCASSKGFSRSSSSKIKRNPISNDNKARNNLVSDGVFTPIKVVEQMQNSSYMQCHHMDYQHV